MASFEDLRQDVDLHVDRPRRERLLDAFVAAPALVDDLDHQRTAGIDRGLAEGVFADLVLAVAVDLGERDLRDPVFGEERQEVVGQFVAVVAGGGRLDFGALEREPVRGELEKPSVFVRLWLLTSGGLPGAEFDVAQHSGELAFCLEQCPSVLGAPEREVLAIAVGSEPQRKARLLLRSA